MRLINREQDLSIAKNKKSLAEEFTAEKIANEFNMPNENIFVKEVSTRLATKEEIPTYFQPLFQQEIITVQLLLEDEKSSVNLGTITFCLGKQVDKQNILYIKERFLNRTPKKRIGLDIECLIETFCKKHHINRFTTQPLPGKI